MCEQPFPLPTYGKVLEAQKIKRAMQDSNVKASVKGITTNANGQPVLLVIFRSNDDLKEGLVAVYLFK